jgi:hypothetical protein
MDVSYPSLQLPQPCVAIFNLRVILTSRVRDDDEGRCAMRRRRSMQLPEGFVRPKFGAPHLAVRGRFRLAARHDFRCEDSAFRFWRTVYTRRPST